MDSAHADVLEIGANGAVVVISTGSKASDLDADDRLYRAGGAADLQTMRAPVVYRMALERAAERFGLSPALLEALVWQESRWRQDAVSSAGAIGLAQLMPGTAKDLGVDPRDPAQNLEGAARYLRIQLDLFDGDIERALAAYNAGPSRVLRARGVPNIAETRAYIDAVFSRLAQDES